MMKIKKRWIIILSIIVLLIIWLGLVLEGRSFYCLENGKCITVWKQLGGISYIMPYKYYGLFSPKDNYIKTRSANVYIDVFWTDCLPNEVLFGVSPNAALIEAVNESSDKITLSNLYVSDEELSANLHQDANAKKIKKKYHDILYNNNSKKASDVKEGVSFIFIDIGWNILYGKKSSKK